MKSLNIALFALLFVAFNANAQLILSSGPESQSVCINSDIQPVVYSYTGAGSITVSQLPSGVTFDGINGLISGTPTVSKDSEFTYTVSVIGHASRLVGSITVHALPTVEIIRGPNANASTIDSICSNKTIDLSCIKSNATIVWSSSNGLGVFEEITGSSSTYTPDPLDELETLTFNVLATSDNLCIGEPPVAADISYFIMPLPDAYISPGGHQCEGGDKPLVQFVGENTVPPYSFTYLVNTGKGDGEFGADEDIKNVTNSSLNSKNGKMYEHAVLTENTAVFTFSLLTVTDANLCSVNIEFENTDTVEIFRKPFADFTINKKITTLYEPTFLIEETAINATIFEWNFGDGDISEEDEPGEHTYGSAGIYNLTLNVSNQSGCKDSITQIVTIETPTSIYFPNSFTPNEDDLNDVFLPKGGGIIDYELSIYNRAGQLVFTSYDQEEGWDGKDHVTKSDLFDAYVYVLQITDLKFHEYVYRGSLSLYK